MSIGQINQKKNGRIVGWLSILVIDERKSIIHMHTQKTHLNCLLYYFQWWCSWYICLLYWYVCVQRKDYNDDDDDDDDEKEGE
jgi:hypothetical protein